MNSVILDASTLLALPKNEPGSNIVENLLGHIVMSSINVSEVSSFFLESSVTLEDFQNCVLPFISFLIPFDEDQDFEAAYLRKVTKSKGLSLGDRACITLGIRMQLPIHTANKIWTTLNIQKAKIRLTR